MFYALFGSCRLLQIHIITFLQQIAFVEQNGIGQNSSHALIMPVFEYSLANFYYAGTDKSQADRKYKDYVYGRC